MQNYQLATLKLMVWKSLDGWRYKNGDGLLVNMKERIDIADQLLDWILAPHKDKKDE